MFYLLTSSVLFFLTIDSKKSSKAKLIDLFSCSIVLGVLVAPKTLQGGKAKFFGALHAPKVCPPGLSSVLVPAQKDEELRTMEGRYNSAAAELSKTRKVCNKISTIESLERQIGDKISTIASLKRQVAEAQH